MTRTLKWLMVFGALLLSLTAVAQKSGPFEVSGMKLGMPLSEFKTAFPNMFCDQRGPGVTVCTEERDNGESYLVNFYQDKLARANVWMQTGRYREVRDQLVRQFGKPSSRVENGQKSKKVEVLTWMRTSPSSMLVIEQAAQNNPDKTFVMMNDDRLMGEMAKGTK